MEKTGDNIVNLGGDKLNINTSTAKGLEAGIAAIATFILQAQEGSNKILYGTARKKYARKGNNKGDVNAALNIGLIPIVQRIAVIDLCNIINFALTQIPGGKPFNPSTPPPSNRPIERVKWAIQYSAYTIQTLIDDFYGVFPDTVNSEARAVLSSLVTQIATSIKEINQAINNSDVKELIGSEYPQLTISTNFLDNAVAYFDRYTNIESIPIEEVQKVLSFIDKTRIVCVAIQGINSPANAINFLESTFKNINIQEQINKIQDIINPARIIPLLRSILRTANKINDIGRKILGYISTARTIITLGVLLLKVFKILVKFFKSIPIPTMFLDTGKIVIITDTLQQKINKFIDKTTQRLNQINAVLSLIIIFINSLLGALDIIINSLKLMLLNLQNCSNIEDNLIKEFEDTIEKLENTKKDLQTVIDTYNNNAGKVDKQFGDYTIQIVTEEVVDEGITLKRRYGIGINNQNNIVVSSAPTFASLDQIIIDEVKVLLISGGYVDSSLRDLNGDQIRIVTESLNYLEDGDINIQDIETTGVDFTESEGIIGITPFLNNLTGGKKLRKRVQKLMKERASQLGNDLKSTDSNSKLNKNRGR